MVTGIWGQTRCSAMAGWIWDRHGVLPVGGQIEGQTQHLARGGRTFDLLDLSKRRSGGRGWPGAPGFGDRHDVWGPAEQIEGQTR